MINSTSAKDIFYASLLELSSKKLLEKISVKDIVENTNLSRQTFYRHFKDKYDLINWSLKVILDQLADEIQTEGSSHYQVLNKLLNTIKNRKEFFIDAFRMDGQNALIDFFHQYSTMNGISNYISQVSDTKLRDEINFAYSFFSYGVVYSIHDWARTGMKEPPEYLAHLIMENIPVSIRPFLYP